MRDDKVLMSRDELEFPLAIEREPNSEGAWVRLEVQSRILHHETTERTTHPGFLSPRRIFIFDSSPCTITMYRYRPTKGGNGTQFTEQLLTLEGGVNSPSFLCKGDGLELGRETGYGVNGLRATYTKGSSVQGVFGALD